jgi:uncharacterized protein CbrC (UPF0167 family)
MIVASGEGCVVCEQARGYLYAGIPFCEEVVEEESICPWCIADRSAHARFAAEFVDAAAIGTGLAGAGPVPIEVVEEVAYRTPGFSGWQQECWFTHCSDAGAFLGAMGAEQLSAAGPGAVDAIRDSTGLEGATWDEFFAALDRNGSPRAYLFRCLHCPQFGGYADAD